MIDISAVHRRKLIYSLVNHYFSNREEWIESFEDWGAFVSALRGNVDERDRCISDKHIQFENSEWTSVCNAIAKKLRFDLFQSPIFDTQTIVDALSYVCRQKKVMPAEASFKAWQECFLGKWESFKEILPEQVVGRMPYGEDVQARIYYELYGVMPFSRDFIFKNYERDYEGKNYLVFPSFAKRPSRLIILFSGNVGRKTYNRYSWYWDEKEEWGEEVVYLFLNDVASHWYVGAEGTSEFSLYLEIIQGVMREYAIPAENVYAVGGSMGGYAAILFAVTMKLKAAIAVNPQLCFKSALRYKEPSWEVQLRECGRNFRELSDEIFRHESRPIIYLEQSFYESDQVGFDDFFQAMRKAKSFIFLKQTDKLDHITENPTRKSIDLIINFIEGMKSEGI